MTLSSLLVLSIFVITIVALIRFQKHPVRIFGCVLLTLFVLDLVSSQEIIKAGSNEGLLTLILLILSSSALEKTRLLRLIAQMVIKPSYTHTFLRLFGFTVISSAFLNNTAVVSSLLAPIRNNPHHAASKLLLPLSYAAILGGTLTLIGTSTNLIVNSLMMDTANHSLGFFDFTAVGLCVVFICGLVMLSLVRFLPVHTQDALSKDHYFIETKVDEKSNLIGKSIENNGLRHLESLFLIEIVRNNKVISPVSPNELLLANDRLYFNGDVTKIAQLDQYHGLKKHQNTQSLATQHVVESILLPDSKLVGKTLSQSNFRHEFKAAVIAIKRNGVRLSGKLGEVPLKAGDFLILTVNDQTSVNAKINQNFLILSGLELEHKLSGVKEYLSVTGFITALVCASLGVVTLFKATLLLFGFLFLLGAINVQDVKQKVPYNIWLIITSAITLSFALQNSDLFTHLTTLLASQNLTLTPQLGLILVFFMTLLLTELVTNNAAAAVTFPIAYSMALGLDANPMAFVMAVAFGASASFISPYGYQTNLMVFNAGQYRLKDFIKLGGPISLFYSITALSAIGYFFGV